MNPLPQAIAVPPQAGPQDEQQSETVLLALLQDALLRRGVRAELRDNGTALMIPRPRVGMPVWVFVGYGGAYFSWQSAEKRHPVNDLEGATQVLAEYVGR
ncbi:hypothetical protein [Streptosporangium carneum]|uniref:Uncharacterized protein n=1 Tax=Streptosporangium carneum TaxID=47481 RepID=A0A9W6HXV6_9ACTN|nr:hypothetical protein [Streptosporangium carneum]GLK07399.1 hypothetical protein GCM10017600_08040 [Streptosporangium carneum]